MTMTPFIIYDYTIHGTQSSHHLKGQFKQFARRINVGGCLGPKHLGTGAACNGTLHDVVSKAVLKIPWVFFWGGHQKKDV